MWEVGVFHGASTRCGSLRESVVTRQSAAVSQWSRAPSLSLLRESQPKKVGLSRAAGSWRAIPAAARSGTRRSWEPRVPVESTSAQWSLSRPFHELPSKDPCPLNKVAWEGSVARGRPC